MSETIVILKMLMLILGGAFLVGIIIGMVIMGFYVINFVMTGDMKYVRDGISKIKPFFKVLMTIWLALFTLALITIGIAIYGLSTGVIQ